MAVTTSNRNVSRSGSRRVLITQVRQSIWGRIDWVLLMAAAALAGIGTLLVWSATSHDVTLNQGEPTVYAVRQAVNIGIGALLGLVVAATDYRWVRIWTPVVYFASILGLGLVFVPGVGEEINGARAWVDLGGLSLQPAEFAKLAVIVSMALVVAEKAEGRRTVNDRADPAKPPRRPRAEGGLRHTDVVLLLAIAAVPAVLILLQPDLGTTLVLGATVFGVIALAGAPRRWLVGLVAGVIAGAVLAVQVGVLDQYQVDRFLAWTNPQLDPLGAGYNTQQARIAIGNGGLFGQGLFQGSQTQSGFVPEQHTDFVFTVAGEELGLVGSTVLIALFTLLLWRALRIARGAEDVFGRLVAGGIVCWFAFQGFQNIGMCLGIMPVTGVPLPLVSYGGTSMFVSLMAIGLLQNIHLRTDHPLGIGGVVRSRVARSRF
ncbi:MAG: rod shape-determining protein RodA [Actinomycetota bacterium]|nr:rod shape-determining protein RodA [Actinomycetota bacterium]